MLGFIALTEFVIQPKKLNELEKRNNPINAAEDALMVDQGSRLSLTCKANPVYILSNRKRLPLTQIPKP
jgi:hypothetical protein